MLHFALHHPGIAVSAKRHGALPAVGLQVPPKSGEKN
jgi:hypothetical protein